MGLQRHITRRRRRRIGNGLKGSDGGIIEEKSRNLLVGTDENHEILSKDCQCPG
jgi:hypothetical protein